MLGIALVASSGVAGAGLLSAAEDRDEVLAVAQDVSYGQRIAAEDLTTARLNPDPAVETVPAAERGQAIGQIAGRDLTAGDVLSPSALASDRTPGTGKALTAIPLKPSQVPTSGLHRGDLIQVVSTPGQNGEATGEVPPSIATEVVRVGKPDADGLTVVDVEVESTDAPTLAARVATGRIAVVVNTPGGD
ncbi:SAF domain-containing protein [Streptomonospora salina]|uniref:SAF domain-containing protein n=1 Tax=Streptomonospora salina TaxID=104205 RepID=A0A841E7C7_9ACTN|nr:SAF domain-containing protein [Streptomonospora salina]MBB5998762.1 hypothetical protein [Streptomonospora salina]